MLPLVLLSIILYSLVSASVIKLNGDNFDEVVDGSRNVLVKFEAEWCGPCKKLAPILEDASKAFPDLEGDTVIAAIDADQARELAERFGIQGFPTVKLFLKGQDQESAIDFNGQRVARSIVEFMNKNIAANNAKLSDDVKNMKRTTSLAQILEDSKVQEQEAYGQQFAQFGFNDPFLKSTSNQLKKTPKKGSKKPSNARKGKPSKHQVSNFPDVSDSTARQMIQAAGNKPVILVFYSKDCPHCSAFLPLAEKLSNSRSDAIFIRIDGDKFVGFRDEFRPKFYPVVIGIKAGSSGKTWTIFDDSRTMENLNTFINKLKA